MRLSLLGVPTIVLLMAAVPASADIFYTFNDLSHPSGCTQALCGVQVGTIDAKQVSTGVVELDLTGSFDWASTGAGNNYQLFFEPTNDSGTQTVFLDSALPTGWQLIYDYQHNLAGDGFSSDPLHYALQCDYNGGHCFANGNTGVPLPQTFTFHGTGLTPTSFLGYNDSGQSVFFVADAAITGTNGNVYTGLIGATEQVQVPEPGVIALLLAMIGGVAVVHKRFV